MIITTLLPTLLNKVDLKGKSAQIYPKKWAILLQQYDSEYIPQKSIKEQVLVDFLADHLIHDDSTLAIDLPDEEAMRIEI